MRIHSPLLTALTVSGLTLGVSLLNLAPAQSAPIVNHADINGLRTFEDLGTGLVWVDLNNFFQQSTSQMQAIVEAAGFTFAEKSYVETLLNSLPLDGSGSDWASYASIMGSAPNRDLIWGSYDDGGDPNLAGWAFSYSDADTWSFVDAVVGINDIPNDGTPDADMNIWAYQTQYVPVPEPSAVFGLGLVGLAAFASKRKFSAPRSSDKA